MNKKYYPVKETSIEKDAVDVFKQKIERKKQEYLRLSLSKNYNNRKDENGNNEECNIGTPNNNKKLIYIETCDTHDKYILNMYDEENKTCEEDLHREEKFDSVQKKSVSKIGGKNEENTFIPLKILSNRYDYSDIVQATNNFSEENKIAKGGNGIVYRGMLKSCINVAIKVLKKNENNGFENEIIIMSRYRHKNILSLLGYAMNKNYFYLIYEHVNLGDLRTLLFNHYCFYNSKNKENADINSGTNEKFCENCFQKCRYSSISNNCSLDSKQISSSHIKSLRNTSSQQDQGESQIPLFLSFHTRVNILVQIINVLCYLHTSSPIVYHRDLKSSNILIDDKFNAKLGDFGLSFIYINNNNVFNLTGGTPGYADPYYISTHEINEQTEIYSFGALILEMLVSKSPAIHVGKNYNCIYNKNDKCPIFSRRVREKNENDENVFDYLVNHINMNDYKSIYSVLDYSVNFPDFLVEKLTKLSFLCLNPNIKNRPSSKLVNLILLEIQKESEFFIKKQQEHLKKKMNCINTYFDEYEREKCHHCCITEWSSKEEETIRKNVLNNSPFCRNEKNKNTECQRRKIKNYDAYISKIKEINYNTLNKIFLKFIHPIFRNDKMWNLNKSVYKMFFSEHVKKNKDTENMRNTQVHTLLPCSYANFKYNTVGNMTNIRELFFHKVHRDIFNNNYVINSFSFNLMNCYFLRFVHDYLNNVTNSKESRSAGKSVCLDHGQGKELRCELKQREAGGEEMEKLIEEGDKVEKADTAKGVNATNGAKLSMNDNMSGMIFLDDHHFTGKSKSGKDENIHRCRNGTSVNTRGFPQNNRDGNDIYQKSHPVFASIHREDNKCSNIGSIIDVHHSSSICNEQTDNSQLREKSNAGCARGSNRSRNVGNGKKNTNLVRWDVADKGVHNGSSGGSCSGCGVESGSDDLHGGGNPERLLRSCLLQQVKNESGGQNLCASNKWPLKRNCRDDTPKMVFDFQEEDNVGMKEGTCLSNKKKIMRINVPIDDENAINHLELARDGLMKEDTTGGSGSARRRKSPRKGLILSKIGDNIHWSGEMVRNHSTVKKESFQSPFKKESIHSPFKGDGRSGIDPFDGRSGIDPFDGRSGIDPFEEKGDMSPLLDGNRKSSQFPLREIENCNVVYISNFINYVNFEKNRYSVDSNTFSWFNKHIFEMIIDESTIVSDVTFLDVLYEFDIFNFKKNIIPHYANINKYTLNGKWSNYDNNSNSNSNGNSNDNSNGNSNGSINAQTNFISVNLKSNFSFEIAVAHDSIKNIHNVFLLKSYKCKDFVYNENDTSKKKIWISDYVGRRNIFVEQILKKSISNLLYECISRKHCLFLLEVQMKTLSKPTCCDTNTRGNFSYYNFQYSIKVVCNSENCIFSNNYILYKNNAYSYSLPNNILSLLVFSEDKVMKDSCNLKNSQATTQRIHFPLYPFFVNINFYDEK
ncbi:tyrosine kinase-like protein, putative (TKL2) [Plasmodium ovale curtisi]|uniref:Tyrosine kinase-like protein, putative (TKL2) n=1 Tax=Plasmodium ovale curtisi TaxID=864141 RepID=A0A1A8WDV3_PLAOA|nr:tyrosine kinase-like protein, putative (TKL2) [Plasmodium ovale curtisi]